MCSCQIAHFWCEEQAVAKDGALIQTPEDTQTAITSVSQKKSSAKWEKICHSNKREREKKLLLLSGFQSAIIWLLLLFPSMTCFFCAVLFCNYYLAEVSYSSLFPLTPPHFCRRFHAPQSGGCVRMQLCGEGAGFRGFQGHTDRLYIIEEWSRRWGSDSWGAKGPELWALLLCLVFHRNQHGLESQCTSQDPWRHYR